MTGILENAGEGGTFIGRIWDPFAKGPSVVTLRDGNLIDITSKAGPTTRDICEMDDPVGYVQAAEGRTLGTLDDIAAAPVGPGNVHLLAPCDLQAVKAAGVTFASSMVERVIEERAAGTWLRLCPRCGGPLSIDGGNELDIVLDVGSYL